MPTPLVSIGIIFKNDIRCIERCLKALQPLRNAVPAELVMADTGSTDGSREIAEKYADILIDFPWIDDFAAARNSLMERASGMWFFSVDTDEYLDENVSELVTFLRTSGERNEVVATINVRNYSTYEMDGDYSDFYGSRIVRMSTGARYEGAIHEHFNFNRSEVLVCPLNRTILHHDGYVAMRQNSKAGEAKRERNMRLIQRCLEKSPDNLLLCMQLVEAASSATMPDYVDHLRRTVRLVQEKRPGWERLGPPILRHALYSAEALALPEWEEWLKLAEEWFPDSMFIRLDGQYAAFAHYWNTAKNPEEALRRGRLYLQALEDYRNGADPMAQLMSPLQMATHFSECTAKISLISAYCNCDHVEDAFELVKSLNYSLLNEGQIASLLGSLQDIHFKSNFDTAPMVAAIWKEINLPEEKHKNNIQRKRAFLQVAGRTFPEKNREVERSKKNFLRYAYTLYLPLQDECDLGRAAAVMELETAADIEPVLNKVENWNDFSIHALIHALECGACFPLPGRNMNLEELNNIASRITQNKSDIFPLIQCIVDVSNSENWKELVWMNALIMAAVRAYPWTAEEPDIRQGVALARAFAWIAKAILPLSYSEKMFEPDRMFAMPPLHRFGWYCFQAFDALDAGDTTGYIRLLREGLNACEGVKDLVEFLIDHTPEVQAPPPSAELLSLAEQIRTVLANFSPEDPAVAALKQSEAYQKVAYLIEGAPAAAWGGLTQ